MHKNGILLISIIVISIGLVSGCTESSNDSNKADYNNFDYSKVEFEFRAEYIGSGSVGWGGIDISFYFTFPSQYFGFGTMEGCKIEELDYVLYGNNHYVSGQTLTELDRSNTNKLGVQGIGTMNGRIEVFEYDTSVYPNEKIWLINLNSELKNAMESETTIKWTASGEMSFRTPDNSQLITFQFGDLIHYQTNF